MFARVRSPANAAWRPWLLGLLAAILAALTSPAIADDWASKPVSYSRDIQPLFAGHCYACHGPDESQRQADLRLDVRESVVSAAIVPGKAAESPLVVRVSSSDDDERMPPPDSRKPALTPAEIDLVRRWIDQGAKYEVHWSFVKPQRPAPPEVKNAAWVHNAIDRFIAAAHEAQGLQPSPEADRRTLMRRLSLDLTGLPPKPAEVDAFLADSSPDAYEKLVDRLLASPAYGERMAVYWLDVARYADTCGYHSDNEREVYLYRDYVIQAFNDNKPFDRFTAEQLAGDLLSGSTREQMIASGYNRLLQTTEEGGAQPKEYEAKFVADRVRNTATAFLGVTLGCAQCHDHKFDPFTSKDFYSFGAFFADVQEKSVGRQDQTKLPTEAQAAALAQLDAQIAPLRTTLDTQTPELDAAQAEWERTLAANPPAAGTPGEPPAEIKAVLAVEAGKRSDPQKQALAAYYRTIAPQLAATRDKLAELKRQRGELDNSIPTSLISQAGPPRVVRILPRGNWMDDSGEIVQPAIPAFFGQLSVGDRRATRLDLANWITSRDDPLAARVMVNRLWRLMFGQGLVRTPGDLGTQGAQPTHPELLDWLAVEFMESGWDVKHMVRLMVTSATYRQSSHTSKDLEDRDPGNLWLARQGQFRLEAEFIRDNALAISGLLSPKIGGPSVKPYQPAGYWSFLNFPTRHYVPDVGENQYRRGLYTFWQRTFLHPSLLTFDASTREECMPDRPRSNTPLQALVALNDPTYVEAARAFAVRLVREGGGTEPDKIQFAFREALARPASPEEVSLLAALYQKHRKEYADDEAAAKDLLTEGQSQAPADIPPAELAAWTSVTRVVLNLHETIARE